MLAYALCYGSGAIAGIAATIAWNIRSRARQGKSAQRARTLEGR